MVYGYRQAPVKSYATRQPNDRAGSFPALGLARAGSVHPSGVDIRLDLRSAAGAIVVDRKLGKDANYRPAIGWTNNCRGLLSPSYEPVVVVLEFLAGISTTSESKFVWNGTLMIG
jgi:hypothetical protein